MMEIAQDQDLVVVERPAADPEALKVDKNSLTTEIKVLHFSQSVK